MRCVPALVAFVALVGCVAVPAASGGEAGAAEGPRVTMFGDSVAASLLYTPQAREILGDGIDLRLELVPCRRLATLSCPYMGERPPSVLDLVRTSSSASLGDIVIMDVGYNEPSSTYATSMAAVLSALAARGVGHVLWLTLREQTENYRAINAAIRTVAREAPQVQVVDWNAESRGKDWFNPDGIHLKAEGAVGLALLVRPYVFAACGAACDSAVAPPARAPRNERPPSLGGTPLVGRTLTCRPGRWSGAAPVRFVYGWVRNGRVIRGAAGRQRLLVAADAGKRLACRVWAGNSAGSARATSKTVLVRRAP